MRLSWGIPAQHIRQTRQYLCEDSIMGRLALPPTSTHTCGSGEPAAGGGSWDQLWSLGKLSIWNMFWNSAVRRISEGGKSWLAVFPLFPPRPLQWRRGNETWWGWKKKQPHDLMKENSILVSFLGFTALLPPATQTTCRSCARRVLYFEAQQP